MTNSAGDDFSRPWGKRDRIIIAVVTLLFGANLVLYLAGLVGLQVLASTYGLLNEWLFAALGVVSGTVAARARKLGNTDRAMSAYRVSVWCLFVAFWLAAVNLPVVRREEAARERREEQLRRMEENRQVQEERAGSPPN